MKLKKTKNPTYDVVWRDFYRAPLKYFEYSKRTKVNVLYDKRYVFRITAVEANFDEDGVRKCDLCPSRRNVQFLVSPTYGAGHLCAYCRKKYGLKSINQQIRPKKPKPPPPPVIKKPKPKKRKKVKKRKQRYTPANLADRPKFFQRRIKTTIQGQDIRL